MFDFRSEMGKNIGSRMFQMLLDDDMTDVTFLVQGSEIRGHRNIISSCGGLLRELIESDEDKPEIKNISQDTFRTVLE